MHGASWELMIASEAPEGRIMNDVHGHLSWEDELALLESQDPSRLPPKTFLRIPAARDAILQEMVTLTTPDARGLPTLAPVLLSDLQRKHFPGIFCTMVVKKKTPIKYKARLRARGGT